MPLVWGEGAEESLVWGEREVWVKVSLVWGERVKVSLVWGEGNE